MFGSPRRPERRLTSVKAQMRTGEQWTEVTLANVSTHGVMVKGTEPPVLGSPVELRRRGVTILGHVVWASRTRFGVQTPEAIDLPSLMAESGLQPDRRACERPATPRRASARWMLWNR